jgi:hypothetical protein
MNTSVQSPALGSNQVAVSVTGSTGVPIAGASIVGIKAADIQRTGLGVVTLDVGITAAQGSATPSALADNGTAHVRFWVGTVITIHGLDFTGAAADVDFSLIVQRNVAGV